MVQELTGPVRAELESEAPALIYLYELFVRGDDQEPVRFTRNLDNITVNGNEYNTYPITHEPISISSEQEVDQVRIFVANGILTNKKPVVGGAQYHLSSLLSGNDIRNKKGRILVTSSDSLDDSAEIFSGSIASLSWNRSTVVINAVSKLDINPIQDPTKLHLRGCFNRFKGPYCRYPFEPGAKLDPGTGDFYVFCPRTIESCELRGNTPRYRGWPSIPRLFRSAV